MPASFVTLAAGLAPAAQRHLLEARQMQALSFAVHIPLVCFGIAFPALLLYAESLYLRTGDELYRTLARRWSRIMAALFENSYLWHELIHMYVAAYMVTGFLLASAYAWSGLRGRFGRYERTALAVALAAAALASVAQVFVGDWNGREVAAAQPTKLAAFEGLGTTTEGAPVHVLGWYTHGHVEYGIPIPRLLSLLAYHDPNARVAGLDAVRADERPPVNVVRIAFQTMVGIGTMLALLGFAYLAVRWRRKRLPESPWFYRALAVAGPLSVVALICGWVTTEVGRQPWVVYRVMRTSEAVTGAGGIPVGYATLALVYLALALAVAWILLRLARAPLDPSPVTAGEP